MSYILFLPKEVGSALEFVKILLHEEFQINRIITLHYFEFAKDFVFEGEKHDFWEFLYVDKGEAEVMADTDGYKLKQGDIIFYKPNQFHSIWANKIIAPNLIVISFECNSASMMNFENKIFNIGESEKNLLAIILKEATDTFVAPFDFPKVNTLTQKTDSSFGGQQMIKVCLEMLLISLVRKATSGISENRLSSLAKERSEDDLIKRITKFMKDNISSNLTLEQVCNYSNLGQTQLKTMFKSKTGKSVIEYFKLLKIEQAKVLIREEKNNNTEISDRLGYSSIHSFSRHFKTVTGMAPSEYAKTVKSRV